MHSYPSDGTNPYFNNGVLNEISARLCDRADELFAELGVSLVIHKKSYVGPCPIHGGRKHDGFNFFPDGEMVRGNWQCYTNKCHTYFRKSVIGFIRGVLSHQDYGWGGQGDRQATHKEAVDVALKLLGVKIGDIEVDEERDERNQFARDVEYLSRRAPGSGDALCTREEFRSAVGIPAAYYLERGYSPRILDEYDVGSCDDPGGGLWDDLRGRVLVPIYDLEHRGVLGCIGRSVDPECGECRMCHPPSTPCPDNGSDLKSSSKWVCSRQFNDKDYLYNYWKAKEHIYKSKCVVILEGAGDVWRCEEAGIHNAVALLGSEVCGRQRELLETCTAGHYVVGTDRDGAGDAAMGQISRIFDESYGDVHRLRFPEGVKDIGEMSVEDIRKYVLPFVLSKMRK